MPKFSVPARARWLPLWAFFLFPWQPGRVAAPAPVRAQRGDRVLHLATPRLALDCDLTTGLWGARWLGVAAPHPSVRGVDAAVRLADGTTLTASGCPSHTCAASDVTPINDAFGAGTQVIIRHRAPGRPLMRQIFRVYPGRSYVLVRLEVSAPRPLATNDISPIVIDGAHTPRAALDLGKGAGRPRTLFVPYDNDNFGRYGSHYAATSHEVTSVYDNASRHGFVLGSVTHGLWKTGIEMAGRPPHALTSLRVYGGAAEADTHDTQPHGMVCGRVVTSPQIFLGYFPDWRDGLEAYGRANARVHPPLAWHSGVPFGWNSWAACGKTVSGADYLAASRFLQASLARPDPKAWAHAYVNFDAFWDNLSDGQNRRRSTAGPRPRTEGGHLLDALCLLGHGPEAARGGDGRALYLPGRRAQRRLRTAPAASGRRPRAGPDSSGHPGAHRLGVSPVRLPGL